MTKLKDAILKKIQRKEIVMKPRWQIFLCGLLIIIGIGILALFALFIAILITVSLKESGMTMLPLFGTRGLFHFLINLPWLIILGVFIALIIVEILFRKFSFGYRTSTLISLGIIGIITVFAAIFLANISPRIMTEKIRNNEFIRTQVMNEGSKFSRSRPITYGTVIERTENTIILNTEEGPVKVYFDEGTHLPDGDIMATGTSLFVGGIRKNGEIKAFGISNEPPKMRMRKNKM